MCFMDFNDEVSSLNSSDSLDDDDFHDRPTYDELLDDLNELHIRLEKLVQKSSALKKKISSVSKELEDALKEKEKILTCDFCVSLEKEKKKASLNEKVLNLKNVNIS